MMLAAAGQFGCCVQVVNIIVKFLGWPVPSENGFLGKRGTFQVILLGAGRLQTGQSGDFVWTPLWFRALMFMAAAGQ
jgi:hypothetical protein